MHTSLSVPNRKMFLIAILSGIILILSSLGIGAPVAHAQEEPPPPRRLESVTVLPEAPQEQGRYYRTRTLALSDGTLVTEHTINGPAVPPTGLGVTPNAIAPNGGPLYLLSCSTTAAADILRTDESSQFPNIYTGSLLPIGSYGTFTDQDNVTYNLEPLIASLELMQKRWRQYQSTAPDPDPGWEPSPSEDMLGGYLQSSHSPVGNFDGDTSYYTNAANCPDVPSPHALCALPRPFTSDQAAADNLPDGTLGMKLFYEARGYAVAEAYNQPTDNVVPGGFSLAQYRAEINSGRRVMIHLGGQSNAPGHSVVGVGYDASSNLIYIHDGWDTGTHTVPWGGTYADMPMFMVSIIRPVPPAQPGYYTISGYVGVPNATISYPGGSTKASSSGYYNISVPPGWSGTITPSKPGHTFQPSSRQYSNLPDYRTKQNFTGSAFQGPNLIQDPSFEQGSPAWIGTSTNFGNPLCGANCGDGARTGSIWGWFGGVAGNETATLSQTLTIPRGSSASLDFYLWLYDAAAGSNAADTFTVKIDGTTVFSANATQLNTYATYIPISVDVTAYANGAPHVITFTSETTSQVVSFFLDDVSLAIVPMSTRTISGNAGVAGATLNYFDGTARSVLAGSNGNYSITVPLGWSGLVTPTKANYRFTPINRSYNNVQNNLTGQSYTAQAYIAGPDTTGVFRPSNGALYLKHRNETGFADVQINYGIGGDYPVVGDWDANGTVTIGIYRNGSFYLRNTNTIGFADIVFPFGMPGDQPIVGDWNGDGIDTIGVYRNGTFFLRNFNDAGAPEMIFGLGVPGDVGIAGDWNGDGMDTTGVFRPSNGALYLKNQNTTGFADAQINYGIGGDKPVTGDWDGDGVDTIGVYRNGQFFLRNSNTIGFADWVFALGIPGDHPIAGNWDGQP
jgi:hypothetical protein